MNTANLKKKSLRPFPAVPGIVFLLLTLLFFAGACSQDAIFYYISQEPELREPLIKGTPTNIVEFADGVYVANFTSLYRYSKQGADQPQWESVSPPEGQIRGLAATKKNLYVLTDRGLFKGKDDGVLPWGAVTADPAYANIQTIYADSQRLFAGSMVGEKSYVILYEETNALKLLKDNVGLLSGAAYDETNKKYFLSTRGSGIFTIADTAFSPTGDPPAALGEPISNKGTDGDKNDITGIICLYGTDIAAIDRDGNLLTVDSSEFTVKKDAGPFSTGALALWRTPPAEPVPETMDRDDPNYPDKQLPDLLLAGIQESTSSTAQTYTNGYREITLTAGKLAEESDNISVESPGNSATPSISNNEKYTTSLGLLPINYMFQVPYHIDPKMTIFASTQKDGLWSYRDHDGNGDVHWNAE
jgi:hypothetical protein